MTTFSLKLLGLVTTALDGNARQTTRQSDKRIQLNKAGRSTTRNVFNENNQISVYFETSQTFPNFCLIGPKTCLASFV